MPPKKKVIQLLANILDLSPRLDASTSQTGSQPLDAPKPKVILKPTEPDVTIITPRKRGKIQMGRDEELVERIRNAGVEYRRLFCCQRGTQTEEECVGRVRLAERRIESLFEAFKIAHTDLSEHHATELATISHHLHIQNLSNPLTHLTHLQTQYITHIRHAAHSRLRNAVARIAGFAAGDLERRLQGLAGTVEAQCRSLEAAVFDKKREARRKADGVGKLRREVARIRGVMKRIGVGEHESVIQDEKLRTEELLTHLQTSLREKETMVEALRHRLETLSYIVHEKRVVAHGTTGSAAPKQQRQMTARRVSRVTSARKGPEVNSRALRRSARLNLEQQQMKKRMVKQRRASRVSAAEDDEFGGVTEDEADEMDETEEDGYESERTGPLLPPLAGRAPGGGDRRRSVMDAPPTRRLSVAGATNPSDSQQQQQQKDVPPPLSEGTLHLLAELTHLYTLRLQTLQDQNASSLAAQSRHHAAEQAELTSQIATAWQKSIESRSMIGRAMREVGVCEAVGGVFGGSGGVEIGVQCSLDPFQETIVPPGGIEKLSVLPQQVQFTVDK
ncbi:hypothetical protein DFS34DRAFT_185582 [Phlyctochytrium arcticum]|nr:hypothetical protein DFS34DRAFT_185582 [Phlyctochytrium arcticum]